MNTASAPYRVAKGIYYSVFNNIATAALRRPSSKLASGRLKEPLIKLVSYYGWQNGIAEGARLQLAALRALSHKVDIVDVTPAMRNPLVRVDCERADVFVVHCGGNQFLQTAWPLRKVLPHGKVVGYFAWELPHPPRDWPKSRFLWDEIWTPSHYSAQALSYTCDKRVKVVPHVLLNDSAQPRVWQKGNEPFVFLTMADARSSLSRKNPRGVVEAFRLAFPHENDVRLIVKLHKTEAKSSPELDRLLSEIKSDSRVRLIDHTVSREEVDSLLLEAHTLVSLHRAEGFGLPLLEAQTFGLATITTAWSGNMDFTTKETSLLVPCTLTTTHDVGNVYGDVTWAEPDIKSAAASMRKLYDDPGEFARIATAGWQASRPGRQLTRFAKSLEGTCLCN